MQIIFRKLFFSLIYTIFECQPGKFSMRPSFSDCSSSFNFNLIFPFNSQCESGKANCHLKNANIPLPFHSSWLRIRHSPHRVRGQQYHQQQQWGEFVAQLSGRQFNSRCDQEHVLCQRNALFGRRLHGGSYLMLFFLLFFFIPSLPFACFSLPFSSRWSTLCQIQIEIFHIFVGDSVSLPFYLPTFTIYFFRNYFISAPTQIISIQGDSWKTEIKKIKNWLIISDELGWLREEDRHVPSSEKWAESGRAKNL